MSPTNIAKCFIHGCTGRVVGGFQRILDAATIDDPNATLPGLKKAWCREHEQEGREGLGRGRFLTQAELKGEKP
jgi:hypothetical protein